MKKIYKLMIEAASSRYALFWLAVISFVESSFFPIPPDIMLIPMVIALPQRAWLIATVATISSIAGGYLGYAIGFWGYEELARPLLEFYGYADKFADFCSYYRQYGVWLVLIAGLTPFPYKVITIASGAVGLNLWVFGLASAVARGGRFFVLAFLLKKWGEPIKNKIEKHFNLFSILFIIALISGFVLIKYLH